MMNKALICLFALLIGACGWHLRGSTSAQITVDQLYVSAREAHGELVKELRQLLRADRVELVSSAELAPYSLLLTDERSERRVVGVGGDALASAYELTLQADYEIRNQQGQLLMPIATSSITRAYDYSPGDAASAHQQESLLTREMRRELAQQIRRRLYAVVGNLDDETERGQTAP